MALAGLALAALGVIWPDHSEFIALANVLAWAAVLHALYKSRLPPEG